MNKKDIARTRPKLNLHILILIGLVLAMALPGLANIPVIDRDEARFAQASVQMAESGDLLNIRFQDTARNKKPAGIYWLQTAAIKIFSETNERTLWAQRLPSVLGALMAVLATYLAGLKLVGRQAALYGAGAFALSFMMVFESHIAKTDAFLCGMGAICFASLAYIRTWPKPSRLSLWKARPAIWAFWVALGVSILIKGPVIPSLVALAMLTLLIWERRGNGIRALVNIPAILLFLLLFIPWAVAIGIETNGAFYAESLGKDLGGKLTSAQESHPGPPGYHLMLLSLTLWPGSLLLLPGLATAFRTLRNNRKTPTPLAKSIRLCLAWIIPYFILIEIMPTKLPHYILPLFPAFCLLIGLGAVAIIRVKAFPVTRFISGLIFILCTTFLVAALIAAKTLYGSESNALPIYAAIGLCGVLGISAGLALWLNGGKFAIASAGLCAVVLNIAAYQFILPDLSDLRLADRLEASFEEEAIPLPRKGGPLVQAINFTEPSLVYRFGREIRLGDQINLNTEQAWAIGNLFIVDKLEKDESVYKSLLETAALRKSCLQERINVSGLNYSRGDEVDLRVIEVVSCEDLAARKLNDN